MKGSKQRLMIKNMKGNFGAACAASALTLMEVMDLLFSKLQTNKETNKNSNCLF